VKVLGIDPGSRITGYGLVRDGSSRPEVLLCGTISADPVQPFPERLLGIHNELVRIIEMCSPDVMAVEDSFYGVNVRTLTVMAQVRGVILLAGASCGIPLAEYSPREVKMSVVGNGGASKDQVRNMVVATTSCRENIESLDAADGVAIALCHLSRQTAAINK